MRISAVALAVVVSIANDLTQAEYFPIVALLLLLPLAAVTVHYGLHGAVTALALLDAGMVVTIAVLQQGALAFQYQLVMIAIGLMGLWLGGGDEFSVILPDVRNLEHAVTVAQDLCAGVRADFALPQGTVHVSCCVGVSLYPQHADDFHVLARHADTALYDAKRRGKGSVGVWGAGGG